jgi:hypothetical protein
MVAFGAYRSSCLAIRFEKHPCDAIREKLAGISPKPVPGQTFMTIWRSGRNSELQIIAGTLAWFNGRLGGGCVGEMSGSGKRRKDQ